MITKAYPTSSENSYVRVTFVVPGSIWAERIYLVGDFHGRPNAYPMQRNHEGDWELALVLPKGKKYQFRYLCDGRQWMTENQADGYATSPDEAGYVCVLATGPDGSAGCGPSPLSGPAALARTG
jgi:hypothetical protein